jgi:hypothetical protein
MSMQIYYVCDNEGPALMDLDELIGNFITTKTRFYLEDIREDLLGRGWYTDIHENGRYLILNIDRLKLTLTHEAWDDPQIYPQGNRADYTEDNCPMRNQGHRDTGRGVCAHCGKVL